MHKYVRLNRDLPNLSLEKDDVGIISDLGLFESLRLNDFYEIDEENYDFFMIEETGDDFDRKVCDRCYKCLLTVYDFENNRIKKGGFITKRPSCRKCRIIKNGIPISAAERRKFEINKPALGTLFRCPICQKTTIVGITKVVLDHNHGNGIPRGWICESCNTGIGRFDDDVSLIENASKWISGKYK